MDAATKEFDLSAYELKDEATLTVQNKKGDDDLIGADGVNPVKIVLYSSGTEQGVKAEHKAATQSTLRMQALLRGKVEKNAAVTAEAEQVDKLTAYTKEVINFPKSAREIYSNPKLGYITRQVQAFIADTSNFA